MNKEKAVVLFSGGQDSTTCLAWATNLFGGQNVYPLAFNYGQKHSVELDCVKRILAQKEQLPIKNELVVLDVQALSQLGSAALTNDDIRVDENAMGTGNSFAARHNLPSTFVPCRNLVFLALAASYAAKVNARNLVTGVCQADSAGYPDCREDFILEAQRAVIAALGGEYIDIHTPLINSSKTKTFALANDLGVLDLIVEETHTCYNGDRTNRHPWGYGCGTCPACLERERGWIGFRDTGVS